MTLDNLVEIFIRGNGHVFCSMRDRLRAVVEALRDEIVHEFRLSGKFHADNLYQLFSEILASDGVERHPTTGNPVGTDTIAGCHPAAAPDVCEWTDCDMSMLENGMYRSACDKKFRGRRQTPCPSCGKPIKFKEAAR